MKSALLVAIFLALPDLGCAAGKYVVRNGRAVAGGGGSHGGGAVASRGIAAQAVSRAPQYGGDGGRAFVGGARGVSGGRQSFYGAARRIGPGAYRVPQRALEGGGGAGAPADPGGSTAPEEAPPHFSKPGALIRTEGHRRFEYAEAAAATQRHAVEAGPIALEEGRASHVNRSHGLRVGPADTLPGRNPGGGASGSGVTPNAAVAEESGARGTGGGTGFDPSF